MFKNNVDAIFWSVALSGILYINLFLIGGY